MLDLENSDIILKLLNVRFYIIAYMSQNVCRESWEGVEE